MRKTRFAAACGIALMLAISAYGQAPYRDQPQQTTRETITQPVMNNGFSGVLDPSRISMNQQFGLGYMSSGGRGYTQGYYLNNISYRFNAPLLLQLHLGATNNPFAQATNLPGQSTLTSLLSNAQFFGGADLIWKPSDDMRFQLSFYQMPATSGYPYGYGYGYRNAFGYGGLSPWGYANPSMMMIDDFQP